MNCTQNQNSKNRVYSKDFKLQTINRILINHEFINSIDIGLASDRILDNWLSKFKENGYNVIEKKEENISLWLNLRRVIKYCLKKIRLNN